MFFRVTVLIDATFIFASFMCRQHRKRDAVEDASNAKRARGNADENCQRRPDLPCVRTQIVGDGIWGANSINVKATSALAQLPLLCARACLGDNAVLSARDTHAHINIHGDVALYARIHEKKVVLRFDHLIVKPNFVSIDTGFGTHMTLVFLRGIGNRVDVFDHLAVAWMAWTNDVAQREDARVCTAVHCALVRAVAPAAAAAACAVTAPSLVEEDACCVCMDDKAVMLVDCVHVCMCAACGAQVDACPMCRAPITMRFA